MGNKKMLRLGLIVLAVITVGKDLLIKLIVPPLATFILGAPVHLGWFSWNIFTSHVAVYDLKVHNPAGFPQGAFVDVEKAAIGYDIPALIGGKLHVPLTDISVKKVILIKNKEGRMNVQSLKVTQQEEGGAAASEKPSKPSKAMPMQLDEIRVNMGEIVMLDYTKSDTPKETAIDIGIKNRVYHNITSVHQLVGAVLLDMTGVAKVAGLAKATVMEVAGGVKQVSGVAINTGKKIFGEVKSIFK